MKLQFFSLNILLFYFVPKSQDYFLNYTDFVVN